MVELTLMVGGIDKQIVDAYAQSLNFDISQAASRKKLGSRIKRSLFSSPDHGRGIPEEVFNLREKSLSQLPEINEAYKRFNDMVVKLIEEA